MKTNLCYANICKHEHEKNITRLWCKIMPKTSVEQIGGNEGSYFYLYFLGILFKEASMCESNKDLFFENLPN